MVKKYCVNMELDEKQIEDELFVKEKKPINNKEYQDLFSISRQNASRDLSDLVKKEILIVQGTVKRNLFYILKGKMRQKLVK